MLKGRPEFDNLQYVAVTLLLARGTSLTLNFSKAVNSSNWSKQSVSGSGEISFMGFGFGVDRNRERLSNRSHRLRLVERAALHESVPPAAIARWGALQLESRPGVA